MAINPIAFEQIKDLLLRNWMTHDALWYGEVAKNFGMGAASPMNLRVCRQLGRIEFTRFLKAVGASAPRDFASYRELFEAGQEIFVPEFITFEFEYREPNTQIFRVGDCFAHKGMEKSGVLSEYECGIFVRIEGWFDAMGLKYSRDQDLSRCLKYKGLECVIAYQFDNLANLEEKNK
jgi:hypothetical protein